MQTTHHMKSVFETGAPAERLTTAYHLIFHLKEQLPFMAARQFVGMTIKRREDDWFIILRGLYKRKAQVCFASGSDPEEAYVNLAAALIFSQARWTDDKFSTTRNDKTGKNN